MKGTPRETEIKLKVEDLALMQSRIQAQAGNTVEPRHFEENIIFDDSFGSLRAQGKLLRLRIVRFERHLEVTKAICTFKGPAEIRDGIKDREEIEFAVDAPANFQLVLTALGYVVSFRYEKYRTIYGFPNSSLHICADETPIGNYLELEGSADDIHSAATRLGFGKQHYITDSYAALFFLWRQKHKPQAAHMTFAE